MSPVASVSLTYHGARFELDLATIREALALHELKDGVTLTRFAEKAGLSRMSIWRLLDGQQVSLPALGRVLRALDLDHRTVLRAA